MTYSITLPFPPTTNHLFATVRGKRVKSATARLYAEHVRMAHLKAREAQRTSCELLELSGSYRVAIGVWLPNKMRRDLDNMLKAPLDGLVRAGAIKDDSLISDLRIYRAGYDKANPRIEVSIDPA